MKKSLCHDLHKQRTIGILDTEFNQNNKIVGKVAMDNALKLNKVANEQFADIQMAIISSLMKCCLTIIVTILSVYYSQYSGTHLYE